MPLLDDDEASREQIAAALTCKYADQLKGNKKKLENIGGYVVGFSSLVG